MLHVNKIRTFVLGIDGLPYSFLQDTFSKGEMPNLESLFKKYGAKKMNSVYPTVSSVAWLPMLQVRIQQGIISLVLWTELPIHSR